MIRICAVGDISLGDHPITRGFGVRGAVRRAGGAHLFRHVKSILQVGDVVFGNLEGVISESDVDCDLPMSGTFRAPVTAINALADGGFNVVNIANNHALQYGRKGFNDTVAVLRAAQIDVAGMCDAGVYSTVPVIKNVAGTTVGILSYSKIAENFFREQPLYAVWDAERVATDIRRLREVVDFIIVSCHWGVEQCVYPPADVRHAARQMVDAGADVVLGHHSHVFQSIERYARGIIFYSLGNFVFDTIWEGQSRDSAVLRLLLEKRSDGKRLTYELVPVRINSQYQPIPLAGRAKQKFLDRLRRIAATLPSVTDDEVKRQAASAERRLLWRKIFFLLSRFYRISAQTWNILIWHKLFKHRSADVQTKPRSTSDDVAR